MLEQIIENFILCNSNKCHNTLANSEFYIYDCPKVNRCIIQDNPHHFKVLNPNKKSINFIAVDNCTIPSLYFRKCDFCIFDNGTISFVEIKTVAKGQRSSARQEAYEQLSIAIKLFSERVNLSPYKIEAIVCLKASKTYPAFSTRSQSAIFKFAQQYNATLLEGNTKTFN